MSTREEVYAKALADCRDRDLISDSRCTCCGSLTSRDGHGKRFRCGVAARALSEGEAAEPSISAEDVARWLDMEAERFPGISIDIAASLLREVAKSIRKGSWRTCLARMDAESMGGGT